MKKEWLSLFYTLIYLSFTVKDRYLISKLDYKISRLWLAMLDFEKNNVAHSSPVRAKLRYLLPDAEELVDLFIHFQVASLSPALQAKKHLLEIWLKLLKLDSHPSSKPLEKKGEPVLPTGGSVSPEPSVQKKQILSDKILELVQKRGQCRMGEMVSAFKSDYAPRTIQRHIQQLTDTGRLKKEHRADGYNAYALAETAQKI